MNELTEKLFAAGYTKDDHPDYVKWSSWMDFEYTPKILCLTVFETPCGLLMDGIDSYSHMGFMGIDWCPENDNSTHCCPYKKDGCPLNNEHLRSAFGNKRGILQCAFHFSNKVYDYENSIEKVRDEFYRMQEHKREKFYSRLKWNSEARHCECIRWDDEKQDWYAKYDPWFCVSGCYNGVCVLTGRKLDGEKGNVFYDVKVTRIYHDGSLWDGQKNINIKKCMKMFDNPKPMAICDAYAKLCKCEIDEREKNRYFNDLFFNKDMLVEVINVRAEHRESRELIQDLRDIQEGITVVHASDIVKQAKKYKKERRIKYKEDKARRQEKRNIAKWKRLMKDDDFVNQYALENGLNIDHVRDFAKKELSKRGIGLSEQSQQISMF